MASCKKGRWWCYNVGETIFLTCSLVWPVMAINSPTGSTGDAMPFSLNFWQQNRSRHFSAAKELNSVKGYFTALPVYWTEGENNLVPFNMRLIADNIRLNDKNIQLAANNEQKGKEA